MNPVVLPMLIDWCRSSWPRTKRDYSPDRGDAEPRRSMSTTAPRFRVSAVGEEKPAWNDPNAPLLRRRRRRNDGHRHRRRHDPANRPFALALLRQRALVLARHHFDDPLLHIRPVGQ